MVRALVGLCVVGLWVSLAGAQPTADDEASCFDIPRATSCRIAAQGYINGLRGYERDPLRGVWLLERGCSLGDGESCERLGHEMASGTAVARDTARAADAFRRGCALRNALSCERAGREYDSLGNALEAIRSYESACDLHRASACKTLSSRFGAGTGGVTVNNARATDYAERACAYSDTSTRDSICNGSSLDPNRSSARSAAATDAAVDASHESTGERAPNSNVTTRNSAKGAVRASDALSQEFLGAIDSAPTAQHRQNDGYDGSKERCSTLFYQYSKRFVILEINEEFAHTGSSLNEYQEREIFRSIGSHDSFVRECMKAVKTTQKKPNCTPRVLRTVKAFLNKTEAECVAIRVEQAFASVPYEICFRNARDATLRFLCFAIGYKKALNVLTANER